MDISLKDKVAIITGGTRGIGFAMVKKFVEAQAKVVIWGSRIETAEAALEKLREAYPDCEAMAMAPVLTDQKQVKEAMALVANKYGRIDILANNAGISQQKLFTDITQADARIVIYPSILMAVPTDNIDMVYEMTEQKLRDYAAETEEE